MEDISGRDLEAFFQQWIHGEYSAGDTPTSSPGIHWPPRSVFR